MNPSSWGEFANRKIVVTLPDTRSVAAVPNSTSRETAMIRIGPVDVSLEQRQLYLKDQPLRVGTRAFDILEVLIEAAGKLVSKDELLERVWPDTIVEESNLQ